MFSHIHALSHAVATPARSGSPGAQVVSRQRLSVCGSERQDILFHENSCEPIMVETRKGSSSGVFLPQERGASVISTPPPPPVCISIACTRQGCRVRHTGPVQRGQFGRILPVVVSQFQLSLQSARPHTSERNLHKLLRPRDWLLSLDVSTTYCHVPLHPAKVHYLSFHLALPASYVNASVRIVQVSLQPGGYWALPHGSAGQYQVVERTCPALPFGYTNSPFIWTKLIKVLARAM